MRESGGRSNERRKGGQIERSGKRRGESGEEVHGLTCRLTVFTPEKSMSSSSSSSLLGETRAANEDFS